MARNVGIVGAGLVGSGWAIVFARASLNVKVYDESPKTRDTVMSVVRANLAELEKFGLVKGADEIAARITVCDEMSRAVDDVEYVQESVFETVEAKRSVYEKLSELVGSNTIIGSSSSGIPASAFTAHLPIKERCLIAHPVNPPYLVPVVEIVPAPWTHQSAINYTVALMSEVGQSPVVVRREVEGFILNRLQGALLNEAWKLFEEGYASIEDIDKTVREGLGLRWAFMGPFETIDLNAPGGVKDYAYRLRSLYYHIAQSRRDPSLWSNELIERVETERAKLLPRNQLEARRRWRDRRLMALVAYLREQRHKDP